MKKDVGESLGVNSRSKNSKSETDLLYTKC